MGADSRLRPKGEAGEEAAAADRSDDCQFVVGLTIELEADRPVRR